MNEVRLIEVFYEVSFAGERIIRENLNTFFKKQSGGGVSFLKQCYNKYTKFTDQIFKKKKELMNEFAKLCILKKIIYESDNYPFLDIFVKIFIDKQMVHEWNFKFTAKLFTMSQEAYEEEILKIFQWNSVQQKMEDVFPKKSKDIKQTILFSLPLDLHSFLKKYSVENKLSMNSVVSSLVQWLKQSEENKEASKV